MDYGNLPKFLLLCVFTCLLLSPVVGFTDQIEQEQLKSRGEVSKGPAVTYTEPKACLNGLNTVVPDAGYVGYGESCNEQKALDAAAADWAKDACSTGPKCDNGCKKKKKCVKYPEGADSKRFSCSRALTGPKDCKGKKRKHECKFTPAIDTVCGCFCIDKKT